MEIEVKNTRIRSFHTGINPAPHHASGHITGKGEIVPAGKYQSRGRQHAAIYRSIDRALPSMHGVRHLTGGFPCV